MCFYDCGTELCTNYVRENQGTLSILFFRFNIRKGLAWSMQLTTFILTGCGFWQLCKAWSEILFHSTVGCGTVWFATAESLKFFV